MAEESQVDGNIRDFFGDLGFLFGAELVGSWIPPLEVLQQRLIARGTDSTENIAVRLQNAKKEMAQQDLFHHAIVNDELSKAISELISIIERYRLQQ